MNLKDLVMYAFTVSLLLTVFGFGLRATLNDVTYLFQRPGLLLRSLLAMFAIMPIVAVLLVRSIDGPRTVEIALLALSISPIPPMLPRKITKTGATSGYGLGLLVAVSLLSLVLVPLAAYLLGLYFGRPLEMPSSKIAATIFRAILLPLAAGMLSKRLFPDLASRIEKPASRLAAWLLIAAVVPLLVTALPYLWKLIEGGTLLMMVAFILIGLAVGQLLAGPGIEHQGVLGLATATRHPGIALALASANFPDERFGATLLLYLVVSALVSMPYIKWLAAHQPASVLAKV